MCGHGWVFPDEFLPELSVALDELDMGGAFTSEQVQRCDIGRDASKKCVRDVNGDLVEVAQTLEISVNRRAQEERGELACCGGSVSQGGLGDLGGSTRRPPRKSEVGQLDQRGWDHTGSWLTGVARNRRRGFETRWLATCALG